MKRRSEMSAIMGGPLRAFLAVSAIVFVAEAVIMLFLPALFPGISRVATSIADATLLILLSAPFLWWFIIENARLYEREQRRAAELQAVMEVSHDVVGERPLEGLLRDVVARAIALTGAHSGTLYLLDERERVLIPRAWVNLGEYMASVCYRLGRGITGAAAESRQGIIVNDYHADPRHDNQLLRHVPLAACMAAPLMSRERLLGVLTLNHTEPGRQFTVGDLRLLETFASQMAAAIENSQLFADLNQSYQALQKAQADLIHSEKLRALGTMAAGIAHDLNNMLAGILGQAELLRLRVADPEVRGALRTLETAATDGAQVVRRLQAFARQQPTGPLVPCDLARLAQEALDLTRPRWKDEPQRRGVAIQVQTAFEDLPPILGQPTELREALTNLILNAVDAMPHGGTLTLRAFQQAAGEEGSRQKAEGSETIEPPGLPAAGCRLPSVVMEVTDTGIGMPTEVRERIFDPFFTTKGGQGTGLGLSVVYGIMERHGGHVTVTSTPGQGTTFTLHFRPTQGQVPAPPPSAQAPGPPRRLLLIDDDPMVRQTITSLLQAAGHTVTEAASGAAGLVCLAEQPVDLILTDLGMPGMTGWEVARAVRSQRPQLPIILLTGWGDQKALEIGESASGGLVDQIVTKPFRLEEILAVIAELSARREAGGRRESRNAD